jgi:predicted O-methyltransferase YrrM
VNIARAETIDGGMNPIELEWLAKQASQCARVVEIGCLRGRSARAMADNMIGPSVLYCVDHFKGSAEHGDAFSKDDSLYRTFMANMLDHIANGRVYVYACPSLEAAALIDVGPGLDMVFIDASHDYDSVKADILAWKPLLRSGGLLCGHDHGHPPIEQVIRELFGWLPTVPGGSIWYTEV